MRSVIQQRDDLVWMRFKIIHIIKGWKMSTNYSRQQIQSLISRNKKRSQKSPPLNPQSPPHSPKQSSKLNRSNSPKQLTQRYQQLHIKYKQLLQQVKDKNHSYELQKQQLQRLKMQKQRDQKQIYRLRSMIGFIKKQDKSMQVNMDMQSGGSWATKNEKSTAIENSQELWTPVKGNQFSKVQRRKSPKQQIMSTQQNKTNGFISAKEHISQITHLNQMFIKGYQNYNQSSRIKSESIYSPKNSEKQLSTVLKIRESRQLENKYKQLSNSPYSKLRFSRKLQ